MNYLELAWLAGLMEGEGCFAFGTSPKITISMTDKDVMEKAALLMVAPCRRINRPTITGKDVFRAELYGNPAIVLMEKLLPFMGERRSTKIREVLSAAATRRGKAVGERAGPSKLTELQAKDILERWNTGAASQSQMAKEYGVSQEAIGYLVNGHTWKHIHATLTPRK